MERVVITGMGFLSPLGNDWPTVREALYENRSAVRHMTDWDETDLNTRVAAPVAPYSLDPELFSRKRTRAMGRVALMAVKASYDALVDAQAPRHIRHGAQRQSHIALAFKGRGHLQHAVAVHHHDPEALAYLGSRETAAVRGLERLPEVLHEGLYFIFPFKVRGLCDLAQNLGTIEINRSDHYFFLSR